MSDILEEFDKYISTNKDVLGALPLKTKKQKEKYLEEVDEYLDSANKINVIIWDEIERRYTDMLDISEDPKILELEKSIESINDIEVFNEINTPFEKLGLDKIVHSLESFFEGNLSLVNDNIKKFVDIFKDYGIELSAEDFVYSDYACEYMRVFFDEYRAGNVESDALKKKFEEIYWKCSDIVTHIQLNMRYLYHINSKKIEKELNARNDATLASLNTDKNGLVRKYFDLNKELIKLTRVDKKVVTDKFLDGTWKINDFNDKTMQVLYDRVVAVDYYELDDKSKEEMDKNLGKLLNTLQEFDIHQRYKYIFDDLIAKCKNKDSYKADFDAKEKELRKKEQELLKYNQNNKKIIKRSKNPIFIFFKKRFEKKMYDFPVTASQKIKELQQLYSEYDEARVNTKIAQYVDDTCTIKYVYKIAISFYSYAFRLVKEQIQKDDSDLDPVEELQTLIEFIDQPYKVMLNNVKVVEEPNLMDIISNRYRILNIKVETVDLKENFDSLLEDVEHIVNFENIIKSGVNTNDIAFIERVKPLKAKMQK